MDLNMQLVQWRRYLHQNPELSKREYETSDYLARELATLGVEVHRVNPTGVVGIIQGRRDGVPTVALRADIDALPVQDCKEVPYKSRVPGVMHACGHDGHTAILLGAAQTLMSMLDEIGKVVLIFQPSEEQPPGGAQKIIEQGFLTGVDWVFGLHLWAGIPVGYAGVGPGPIMANADEFVITVTGKGGHGSMPQDTIDSVLVAAQIVVALQSIVSRSLDPREPTVVSVGLIQGGTGFNIIAQETIIRGTYRSFSASARSSIENRLQEISHGICNTFGAVCKVECKRGYSAVVNPVKGADLLKAAAIRVLGQSKVVPPQAVLGGEDFGYYLQQVPGAFMFLGAAPAQVYSHHHGCFDFAEEAMLPGVNILVEAVLAAGRTGQP